MAQGIELQVDFSHYIKFEVFLVHNKGIMRDVFKKPAKIKGDTDFQRNEFRYFFLDEEVKFTLNPQNLTNYD